MASRKWNSGSAAEWILETARARAERITREPLEEQLEAIGRLEELDAPALSSLSARLGRILWKERLYPNRLIELRESVLKQRIGNNDSLGTSQRALLSVVDALIDALLLGDEPVAERASVGSIETLARAVWRTPIEERAVVDAAIVRSILEPLLAGDRRGFREVLGTLARELVTLATKGTDSRLPNVTELYAYQQLRSLQDTLNAVLQGSRASVPAPAGVAAGI